MGMYYSDRRDCFVFLMLTFMAALQVGLILWVTMAWLSLNAGFEQDGFQRVRTQASQSSTYSRCASG